MRETLIGLTDERFVLTSIDQGESWAIVTRLPLTLTYHSLGIPARASDPLLVATDQGLYEVGEEGTLTLVRSDALTAVSYSHTNPDELWAVRENRVYKSEDRGATWGEAPRDRPKGPGSEHWSFQPVRRPIDPQPDYLDDDLLQPVIDRDHRGPHGRQVIVLRNALRLARFGLSALLYEALHDVQFQN